MTTDCTLKKLTLPWIQIQFVNYKFAISLYHATKHINISDVFICRQMSTKALICKSPVKITIVNIYIRRKAAPKWSTYDQMWAQNVSQVESKSVIKPSLQA